MPTRHGDVWYLVHDATQGILVDVVDAAPTAGNLGRKADVVGLLDLLAFLGDLLGAPVQVGEPGGDQRAVDPAALLVPRDDSLDTLGRCLGDAGRGYRGYRRGAPGVPQGRQ